MLPLLLFECDLAAKVCCLERGSAPLAMRLGGSLKALYLKLGAHGFGCAGLRGGGHACRCRPGAGVPSLLQVCWVEGWRVVDDGLLAGIEVGELLIVEVAESAGEVAVGLQAGVVEGGWASGREAAGRGPSMGVWWGTSNRSR